MKDGVDAIDHLTKPTTIRDLRHALGLQNFQRRFIKDASKILLPLTKYLQGQVKNSDKITFNSEAKQAFSDMKTTLNKATGLAHPREDAKCVEDCGLAQQINLSKIKLTTKFPRN